MPCMSLLIGYCNICAPTAFLPHLNHNALQLGWRVRCDNAIDVRPHARRVEAAAARALETRIVYELGRLRLFEPRTTKKASSGSGGGSSRASSKSSSLLSLPRTPGDERELLPLRQRALAAYGLIADGENRLRCPVLMLDLPASTLACAHLVPRCMVRSFGAALQKMWGELGVDMDETRNVLLLFKCIEEAYDDYLLSFVWTDQLDEGGRTLYRLHVWDPALLLLPITTNVRNRDRSRFSPPPQDGGQAWQAASQMTFGHLHGQHRALAAIGGHAPYGRALCLQATLARCNARARSWPDLALPAVVSFYYNAEWSSKIYRISGVKFHKFLVDGEPYSAHQLQKISSVHTKLFDDNDEVDKVAIRKEKKVVRDLRKEGMSHHNTLGLKEAVNVDIF